MAVDYGPDAGDRSRLMSILDIQAFPQRLWAKDPTVWRQGPEGAKEIAIRLGWLDVMQDMLKHAGEITAFADEVRKAGFKHTVLMGMGGSSLSPEVSKKTFGVKEGYPDLFVLDSTIPGAILDVERAIDLQKTLFVVAMKSGSTVETNSCYRYFYEKVKSGANFAAITDPGTSLEKEANDKGFRKLFLNPPDIGGRFSALSYFGLVPAALIGVDIVKLLNRAVAMAEECGPDVPVEDNPGIVLGAALADLALLGTDKMTMVLPEEIASFGYWVEQLVAESTGKMGREIVPIEGEPLWDPGMYDDDRLFVHVRLKGQKDSSLSEKMSDIADASFPVIAIEMDDVYDIGGEYFRWEMATAAACALLGVNAFDQPNVQDSKTNTFQILESVEQTGALPDESPFLSQDGVSFFTDSQTKGALDAICSHVGADNSADSYLAAFVALFQPGNYFGLMAFVNPTEDLQSGFAALRTLLTDVCGAATTLGFGPRFLHSTGQLHKGGANNGLFIQFTADDAQDISIPGVKYSFATLKNAQALGDAQCLITKGRPFLRIHLGKDAKKGLKKVLGMLQ